MQILIQKQGKMQDKTRKVVKSTGTIAGLFLYAMTSMGASCSTMTPFQQDLFMKGIVAFNENADRDASRRDRKNRDVQQPHTIFSERVYNFDTNKQVDLLGWGQWNDYIKNIPKEARSKHGYMIIQFTGGELHQSWNANINGDTGLVECSNFKQDY